jgi:hypothetical protein
MRKLKRFTEQNPVNRFTLTQSLQNHTFLDNDEHKK